MFSVKVASRETEGEDSKVRGSGKEVLVVPLSTLTSSMISSTSNEVSSTSDGVSSTSLGDEYSDFLTFINQLQEMVVDNIKVVLNIVIIAGEVLRPIDEVVDKNELGSLDPLADEVP